MYPFNLKRTAFESRNRLRFINANYVVPPYRSEFIRSSTHHHRGFINICMPSLKMCSPEGLRDQFIEFWSFAFASVAVSCKRRNNTRERERERLLFIAKENDVLRLNKHKLNFKAQSTRCQGELKNTAPPTRSYSKNADASGPFHFYL